MNEDLQRKYIEFQLFDQQLKQFQQQLQILRQQLNELSNLDEHLNEIDKVKEGSKIMAPLGAGVFVKAEIKDNKNVLMNVGAKTLTAKPINEAKEIVGVQVKELSNVIKEMEEESVKLITKCDELQMEIQQEVIKKQDKQPAKVYKF
ncbi:MAG TPA: prefoldin subunit alpha [Candidatus Nanoarchaeia archaeon]|nr:prefoldin subunit alpha [Candidatus Nanoarchaeia archaeon]